MLTNRKRLHSTKACTKVTEAASRGGFCLSICAQACLSECRDRVRLVLFHVEDREELRDDQEVLHLLGEVRQLQVTSSIFHRGVCTYQFAQAGAVDVVDVCNVQQNLLRT